MSYKSTLQEHNTLLQQAIDKANDLPDAGSGGAVETCTVTVNNPSYYAFGWTNGEQNFVDFDFLSEQMQIEVMKGSALIINYGSGFSTAGDIVTWIDTQEYLAVLIVNGNGAITIS